MNYTFNKRYGTWSLTKFNRKEFHISVRRRIQPDMSQEIAY